MIDIKIQLPVCNQFDEAHGSEWGKKICPVCSLWMLIKHHNPNFNVPVMDLVKECLDAGGYLENIGWKHAAIAELGRKYGLNLTHAQKFFYTPEEKEEGMKIINESLKAGKPVIFSLFNSLNPAKSSHMAVINGLQEFNDTTIGYYIQDPDGRWRGHNYFLARQDFLDGWRGGLIWVK